LHRAANADRDRHQTKKAFEALDVEHVFPTKDGAINYAQTRACLRSGEIRVMDSTGNIERAKAFNEANRKL
jgi:hypothetical protein